MTDEAKHVFRTLDEFFAAQEAGLIPADTGDLITEAGGLPQYVGSQVLHVIAESGLEGLRVFLMEPQPYRGSGATQSILVTQGEKEVTAFSMTIELGGALMDISMGALFIDNEGIRDQLLKAVLGGSET